MVSLIERLQSILAGVVLALLVASLVLVPQNRALADRGGEEASQASTNCTGCTGCKGASTPCPAGVHTCLPVSSTCESTCDCVEHPTGGGKCWCRE